MIWLIFIIASLAIIFLIHTFGDSSQVSSNNTNNQKIDEYASLEEILKQMAKRSAKEKSAAITQKTYKMKKETLQEFLSEPSEIGDITAYLCEFLKQQVQPVTNEKEALKIYTEVLLAYNKIVENRWHKMNFKDPKATVRKFINFIDMMYVNNYQMLNRENKNLTDITLLLNYDIFIFFALLDEFPIIKKAYKDSIQRDDNEYFIMLQVLHQCVSEICSFQSTYTEKEFIRCAYLMFSELNKTKSPVREDEFGEY